MTGFDLILLIFLIFIAAMLYSSVGHGGASGYLAAMALLGVAPMLMKPTALALNILVAGMAWWQFNRRGAFEFRRLWPFIVLSIPCAFIGGAVRPDGTWYGIIVGIALWAAALRLWSPNLGGPGDPEAARAKGPPILAALLVGAGIGWLSGLTGVGGGIFLSPVLLLMRWADARQTAGVSAAFIVVNSIAGLAGQFTAEATLPFELIWLAPAAVVGGFIGSTWGSARFNYLALRRMLALVLIVAGAKMLAGV